MEVGGPSSDPACWVARKGPLSVCTLLPTRFRRREEKATTGKERLLGPHREDS